jgi:hypothetical protein
MLLFYHKHYIQVLLCEHGQSWVLATMPAFLSQKREQTQEQEQKHEQEQEHKDSYWEHRKK